MSPTPPEKDVIHPNTNLYGANSDHCVSIVLPLLHMVLSGYAKCGVRLCLIRNKNCSAGYHRSNKSDIYPTCSRSYGLTRTRLGTEQNACWIVDEGVMNNIQISNKDSENGMV
jgi:hypothetical protein